MIDSDWLTKEQLEKRILEEIKDNQYDEFVAVMERLLQHPYSYECKEFIMQNRRDLVIKQKGREIIEPKIGEDGRKYVTTCGNESIDRKNYIITVFNQMVFVVVVTECRFKTAIANVTVISPGS